MKYVYIVISVLLIQISFAQTGVNERDVQNFRNKSSFKGKLSKTEVPLDYSLDKKSKPSIDTLEDNPFREQLDGWDRVHSTPEAQTLHENKIPYHANEDNTPLIKNYDKYDSTDWTGIIITGVILIVFAIAGVFLYKLLK